MDRLLSLVGTCLVFLALTQLGQVSAADCNKSAESCASAPCTLVDPAMVKHPCDVQLVARACVSCEPVDVDGFQEVATGTTHKRQSWLVSCPGGGVRGPFTRCAMELWGAVDQQAQCLPCNLFVTDCGGIRVIPCN